MKTLVKQISLDGGGLIDVLTGGFPCQPFSIAGNKLGNKDSRYLWSEMLRAIREIGPSWIVGENVRGLVNWNEGVVFEQVCADLENEGYEVFPVLLPAAGVNAPHRRERIWFIAYSNRKRFKKQESSNIPTAPQREPFELDVKKWTQWPNESPVFAGYDGLSCRLDGNSVSNWHIESLKAAGNAIVPQVALRIFETIDFYEMLYV